MIIRNAKDIMTYQEKSGLNLYEIALKYELKNGDQDEEMIMTAMEKQWHIMTQAIEAGLNESNSHIKGKILKREAFKLKKNFDNDKSISGDTTTKAMAYALSTMEVNISMGQIVAAPTAGACGVLPGTLKAIQERFNYDDKKIVEALFVAGMIGIIIARNASISGAKGGCQAEIGTAASMAAGAIVYLQGGKLTQIFDAAAIAINNMMGLICDPVAGLVEVPCHKRNAIGASNALICAEMVLAGMPSIIPFDEVVGAMKQVGDLLPACHRETATGGIAITDTARLYKQNIFGKNI